MIEASNSTDAYERSSTMIQNSKVKDQPHRPRLMHYSSNNSSEEESSKYWNENKKLNILRENSYAKNNIFFMDLKKSKGFFIQRIKEENYFKNISPIEVHRGEIEDRPELEFTGYDSKVKSQIEAYLLKYHKIKTKMSLVGSEQPQSPEKHPWYTISCRVTDIRSKKMDIFSLKSYHSDKQSCLVYAYLELLSYLHHTLFVLIFERDRSWIFSDILKKTNSSSARIQNPSPIVTQDPSRDLLNINNQTLSTIKGGNALSFKTEDMTFRTLDRQLGEGIRNQLVTSESFTSELRNIIGRDKIGKYLDKVTEKFGIEYNSISFDDYLKNFKFGQDQKFDDTGVDFKMLISGYIERDEPLAFLNASLKRFFDSEIKIFEIREKNIFGFLIKKIENGSNSSKIRIQLESFDGAQYEDAKKLAGFAALRMLDKANYRRFLKKRTFFDNSGSMFSSDIDFTMIQNG